MLPLFRLVARLHAGCVGPGSPAKLQPAGNLIVPVPEADFDLVPGAEGRLFGRKRNRPDKKAGRFFYSGFGLPNQYGNLEGNENNPCARMFPQHQSPFALPGPIAFSRLFDSVLGYLLRLSCR